MNSTKPPLLVQQLGIEFERYVNFEFYKTNLKYPSPLALFERYVNFEFYKTHIFKKKLKRAFERYVNFEFYKTLMPT